jgi:hypothetical protein
MDQSRVASLMAETIVDHLQPVDVDEQQGAAIVVALRPVDHAGQLPLEPAPVGQGHQRIMVGQAVEFANQTLQPPDLAAQPRDLGTQLKRIVAEGLGRVSHSGRAS